MTDNNNEKDICFPSKELDVIEFNKQQTNDITFNIENGAKEIMRICKDGDIFVHGRLIENDTEITDALREFLRGVESG